MEDRRLWLLSNKKARSAHASRHSCVINYGIISHAPRLKIPQRHGKLHSEPLNFRALDLTRSSPKRCNFCPPCDSNHVNIKRSPSPRAFVTALVSWMELKETAKLTVSFPILSSKLGATTSPPHLLKAVTVPLRLASTETSSKAGSWAGRIH